MKQDHDHRGGQDGGVDDLEAVPLGEKPPGPVPGQSPDWPRRSDSRSRLWRAWWPRRAGVVAIKVGKIGAQASPRSGQAQKGRSVGPGQAHQGRAGTTPRLARRISRIAVTRWPVKPASRRPMAKQPQKRLVSSAALAGAEAAAFG